MKVRIIKNDGFMGIQAMYVAARTCYSADHVEDLVENNLDYFTQIDLIMKVLKSGHESIAEHYNFTIGIDGISRSCSHQLVRHRLCTFSQQSQRYVNFSDKSFDYVTPASIEKSVLLNDYNDCMTELKKIYDKLVFSGIKPEDARYVLPNAACTNITFSCNLRQLMHVSELRLCSRAQWEIREVFEQIREAVLKTNPEFSELLIPKCEKMGFCNEHQSCGRYAKKS